MEKKRDGLGISAFKGISDEALTEAARAREGLREEDRSPPLTENEAKKALRALRQDERKALSDFLINILKRFEPIIVFIIYILIFFFFVLILRYIYLIWNAPGQILAVLTTVFAFLGGWVSALFFGKLRRD